jgi:coenzyme F420-reducing hydrogenase beta subunit
MACANVCNFNSIEIRQDNEGFYRPVVNEKSCTECGLCASVCPVLQPLEKNEKPLKVYSGWSKNKKTRLVSSSGGAFTEIAKEVLTRNGVVFGVEMNSELVAVHSYITDAKDLWKFQGSKYVQSYIAPDLYTKLKGFLGTGKMVLFSGTPCQVAGLKKFLHRSYKNLLTVDLICHGVPSPLIFEVYKKYIELKEKMKIEEVKFRSKKYSWIYYNMRIRGRKKDGKEKEYIGTYFTDPWIRGFLRDHFLQPACHKCQYTSIERVADITIADWWKYKGTKEQDSGFRHKGVSLILCNSKNGQLLFDKIKHQFEYQVRSISDALATNVALKKSFKQPDSRKLFWNDFTELSTKELVDKWMSPESVPLSRRLQNNFKNTKFLTLLVRIVSKVERVMQNKIS